MPDNETWIAGQSGMRLVGEMPDGQRRYMSVCTEPDCDWMSQVCQYEATADDAFAEHYAATHGGEVVGPIPKGEG